MKQKGGLGEKVHDRGPIVESQKETEEEKYASIEKALSHLRDLSLYPDTNVKPPVPRYRVTPLQINKRPTALDDFLTEYLNTIISFTDIKEARKRWIEMWDIEKKTYKNNPLFSDEIMTEIYDLVTDNINNYNTVKEIRESLMTPDEEPSSPAI